MEFPDYFASTCCSVLREYRVQNSLSQEELAKKSGLARSYICDVERAARHPSLRNLNILSKALNIATSDLIHDTELKMASSLDIESLTREAVPSQLQRDILNYFSDCSSDGMVICNGKGQFVMFNNAAERLTGLGMLQIDQQDWPNIYGLFLADQSTLYSSNQLPLSRAIKGEKVIQADVFVKNAKANRLLKVSGRPVKDNNGAIVGGVVLFRDIAEIENAISTKDKDAYSLITN